MIGLASLPLRSRRSHASGLWSPDLHGQLTCRSLFSRVWAIEDQGCYKTVIRVSTLRARNTCAHYEPAAESRYAAISVRATGPQVNSASTRSRARRPIASRSVTSICAKRRSPSAIAERVGSTITPAPVAPNRPSGSAAEVSRQGFPRAAASSTENASPSQRDVRTKTDERRRRSTLFDLRPGP
jgi:hypothetical protein